MFTNLVLQTIYLAYVEKIRYIDLELLAQK